MLPFTPNSICYTSVDLTIPKLYDGQVFMAKQKDKKNRDFEAQVYSFYRKHNIPFENPPTKTPEEYGRAIVREMTSDNFSDQKNFDIKLAGTTEQGRFI